MVTPLEQRPSPPLGPPAALVLVHGARQWPMDLLRLASVVPRPFGPSRRLAPGTRGRQCLPRRLRGQPGRTVAGLPTPVAVCGWSMGRRGISVPSLSCPSLVVYGDQYRDKRGPSIARHYGAAELYFPGLDQWGLVRSEKVRESIAVYLGVPSTRPRERHRTDQSDPRAGAAANP